MLPPPKPPLLLPPQPTTTTPPSPQVVPCTTARVIGPFYTRLFPIYHQYQYHHPPPYWPFVLVFCCIVRVRSCTIGSMQQRIPRMLPNGSNIGHVDWIIVPFIFVLCFGRTDYRVLVLLLLLIVVVIVALIVVLIKLMVLRVVIRFFFGYVLWF